ANAYVKNLGYETSRPKSPRNSVIDDERTLHEEKTAITISSLMTVLCSIGLLRSAASLADSGGLRAPQLTVLQDVAIDAQQMLELDSARKFPLRKGLAAVPLFAAGLVQATQCRSQQAFVRSIPALFDRLMDLNHHGFTSEEGGSFLCAVADCCAKGTAEDVFNHTQKIVQHIQNVAASLKPLSRSHEICSRISAAAALEFADSTKNPQHLHWALDVEQEVTGANLALARRTPAKTPLRGQAESHNGYRWEAGICEWVAKTPAIAFTRLRVREQQEAPEPRIHHDEHPSQKNALGVNHDFSPHSTRGSSKAATIKTLLQKHHVPRTTKSLEACKPATTRTRCARSKFFSHIYVEDEGDELSMSESSQEAQAQKMRQLEQIENSISQENQRGMGTRKGFGLSKLDRSRCKSLAANSMYCVNMRSQEQESGMSSEDELSFL
ncbi:MAG: hypothetical protein L6R41_007843, partial [Letrouitia leprolyta]